MSSIFSNQTLTKVVNNPYVRKFATQMSNHKALLPVMLLETTVISGRSYQAYKRGGITEFRERVIDESVTAAVWFGIISWLNKGFEKLIKHKGIFNKDGLPEIAIDFGSDAIRNPIRQAVKQRPEIKNIIGGLKISKIAISALAGIYLSGVILPKFYQNLTRKILRKEKHQRAHYIDNRVTMEEFLNKTSKTGDLSFRGGFINSTAHILENNPIAKLLTIDLGLFIGRGYSARNNDERTEILFRDFASSFFYMFSTPLIYNALSKYADPLKGKNTDLDPNTVRFFTDCLKNKLKKANYTPDELRTMLLGKNESLVTQILPHIESETLSIKKFSKIIQSLVPDSKEAERIIDNAKRFISLRPKGASTNIITMSEMINSIQGGYINGASFLTRAVKVSTRGISQDPKRFIKFEDIDEIKLNIKKYAESLITYAKKTGQKTISPEFLTRTQNRNLILKVAYTVVGMAVSSLFLSTLIPKLQYKLTEYRTGKKDFPGIRDIK